VEHHQPTEVDFIQIIGGEEQGIIEIAEKGKRF
jgi:hypothetical protein